MKSLYKWTRNKLFNSPSLVLWLTVGFSLRLILLIILNALCQDPIPVLFNNDSALELAIKALVLAPLFETAVFQLIPIELIQLIPFTGRYKAFILISISALLFALVHMYSLAYVVLTFVMGFFMAAMYWVFRRRHGIINAFWAVVFFHFCYNLFTFVLRFVD